jgi:uncharacterized protein YpmB
MWSVEIIIALTVFIVVFVGVLSLMVFSGRDAYREQHSETVNLASLMQDDYALINSGTLDKRKFSELAEMNYTQLKKQVGARSDFCIFIEGEDGKIMPVRFNGKNYSGIGNGSGITIGGKPCGQ